MEIIPAILPKDFHELEQKIETVKGATRFIQIDICDGKFVPSTTWPYKKMDNNFEQIIHEERGLPGWEDVEFEIDLMVKNPEQDIMHWISAGAARVIIHVESTTAIDPILEQIGELVDVGLALNIDTPNDRIDPYIGKVKFVQCMGIARIGFQGQEFDDRVLAKIKEIKKKHPHLTVSVDGGVNLESAPLLKHAGVDRIVVGSAVFGSEIPSEAIRQLEQI